MKHLLAELEKHNIQISLNGENLDLSSNNKAIDTSLLDQVRKHKSELIDYLKKYTHSEKKQQIQPIGKNSSYQLSDAQKRLWILGQFENASNAYNMPAHIILKGQYDPSKFGLAIASVLQRHEILRTVFKKDENGEIRQWILPLEDLGFQLDYKDFTSEEKAIEKAESYISEDSFTLFDLENGPLVRVSMLQLSSNSCMFYYNMHHIISDGWSMEVLAKDVMSYYAFYKDGIPLNLSELKIQYKDYAAWQQTQTNGVALKASKIYWSERLGGELPVLTLPSQKLRPGVKTYNGHSLRFHIPSELTQGLRDISRETGGSLFIGLLTVWNILMYRYTSQEDMIIGTAVAGRDHTDLEDQIGFYVNTLALRNTIQPENSFYQTLNQIKQVTLEAYEHQMYPFDRLIEDLSIPRDSGRSPIFEVMLTLQNIGDRHEKRQTEESDAIEDLGKSKAKFDLSVSFEELGDHLSFIITYNTDVYEYSMVSQLMIHFKSLLKVLLEAPDVKVANVDYLSKAEKDMLLHVFNDTFADYPKDKTVIDLFNEQVLANPDATVLTYNDRSMSYKELDEKSRRLADYLICNGIQKQLIPICVDRSIEMVIGILGILRSGNSYVPIEGNFPKQRIQYILEDTQSSYVVTTTSYVSLFDNVNILNLETFDYTSKNLESISIHISPADLAYCIYTSGTTGIPKGVLNEHGALLNRLLWMRDELKINSGSVLLQKTPYIFDVSVWELIMPLITGCELFIAKPDGHKDPLYLLDLIEANAITTLHFVPSMFGLFLDYATPQKCKSLKHIICSGEALPMQMVRKFKAQFKEVQLLNYYGPTEAAIDVTSIELTDTDLQKEVVSIGSPVANTKIYIADKFYNIQPPGVVGELLIGGVQVARGYLNKPELTAEKFIASPFLAYDRLYKTGDLAYWQSDGSICYVGRNDNQVKINGNRIELGEVEQALSGHEEIKNCAVTVKERNGKNYLTAYYTADTVQHSLALKSYLQGKLPVYMVPEYFIHLQELPLTVTGKLDKKSLPELEINGTNDYVAPSNEIEQRLVNIWAAVLKLDKDAISVHKNFFELGGNSLDIITLNTKINLEFNCNISVTEMFSLNTIIDMKEFIAKGGKERLQKIGDTISDTINDATDNLKLLENI